MPQPNSAVSDRRSFLTRFSAGAAAFAATLAAGGATARGQTPVAGSWQPARHEKDDWLDQLPGRHRIVFDSIATEPFADALLFANNFIRTNRTDYNLQHGDLAVLIIARHRSTSHAFNDQMWEKYGKILSARSDLTDPKTKQPPTSNLFNSAEASRLLPSRGNTLEALLKLGVQFAVCSAAARAVAGGVAEATGQKTDDVFKEFAANLISGTQARMVPAGIVTVARAQERGYSLVA